MEEKLYFCITIQAIHNKDYSVVKTTKGAETITPSPFLLAQATVICHKNN